MHFDHILWLDLETRSRVDLDKHGAYRYKDCPDHRVLIAGWALDNGRCESAILNGTLPVKLRNILADKRVQIRAHNAAFDRLQLNAMLASMGIAPIPIERWYCTAAQARAIALPGSLANLGRAMKLPIGKDPRGGPLMRLLSIPAKDGTFSNDPKLMAEYALYCGQDVAVMRAASNAMPDLRDIDLRAYWANEHINDRGLPLDVELCRLAVRYAAAEKIDAAARVFDLSGGVLRTTQGKKMSKWVWNHLDPIMQKHMEKRVLKRIDVANPIFGNDIDKNRLHEGDPGVIVVDTLSLAVDVRSTLLNIAENDPDAIEPDVVEMIEACEAGSMSSVAKFQTMLDRVSADGRLRGAFMFNGAYQTNRFSSTGAQVHNFPREVAADPEAVLAAMRDEQPLGDTLRVLKGMLRPAIAPRGKVIVRADWNAIEARGLPWLVDTPASREYMAAFTEEGRDIYIEQSHIAGLRGERQPGKVVVLALGYGGGPVALSKMAKSYGVHIRDMQGVVTRWRRANPWVSDKRTGWWEQLKRCVAGAMEEPGRRYRAGRVEVERGDSLMLHLPSGRTLHYPKPRWAEGDFGPEVAYLKASWHPKAGAEDWPTARLWHGVTAENADQAICADLLRESLVRCQEQGIEVIGHVHDEIITEAAPSRAKAQGKKLQRCMLTLPEWAKGLPLKAEVDTSPRFRK